MANTAVRFLDYTEIPFKFKSFCRKIFAMFALMFKRTPDFHWEILNPSAIDKNLSVYEKISKYELSRSVQIIKFTDINNRLTLNKILANMGFIVEVIWGEAKYSDGAAVKDIGLPPIYSWFWNIINFILIKLPLPKVHFILPAFGAKRLHLRLFQDKKNKCWYITSHVDNTNLLSLRPWDMKEAIDCHLRNKIQSDYTLGPKLLIELLEKYFRKENIKYCNNMESM